MTAPALLWDLDGTLADTATDIALTVNEMLTAAGLPPLPLTDVHGMIGSGAGHLVDRAVRAAGGVPGARHLEAFLAGYRRQPRRVAELYPGIAALLADVRVPQGVVTNKPEAVSRALLAALGVDAHFSVVVGGDTLPVRKPDAAPVHAAMRALGVTDAVLVGDGPHDVGAARAAGIRSIGVLWGIGSPVGADVTAHDVGGLRDALAALGILR